ncbi:ABC transporter ATP-binding protein [Candidatus Bipolaricaulota bacterium]
MRSEEILEVAGLSKHFSIRAGLLQRTVATVRAVEDVSFRVRQRDVLGLVGESGSGKSTVARVLAGIYPPTSGVITFKGQDVPHQRHKRRHLSKDIQMVFQDPKSSLNPRRSIFSSLRDPLAIHGMAKTRRGYRQSVAELLKTVELPSAYMHKHPAILSGGQRQRVAIARALAVSPALILLDEPTSALDVSVQAKIIKLLTRLQAELDLSYVFISHDLSLLRNVCSAMAVMYVGRIYEKASTDDLFTDPRHPYTRGLLSAIPVVSAEDERAKPAGGRLGGEIPDPACPPNGCAFHPRCAESDARCESQLPEFLEVTEGHFVRCHSYSRMKQDPMDS